MEVPNDEINIAAPPRRVSLSPFPIQVHPSPRRLSTHFTPPTRPVRAVRQLAWVSLQGRIVGAEEASSAKTIGGGRFSPEEAVTWELFSPMHRILIVAVIGVAAANSKKNKTIAQLKKSVEIRDQVLLAMQQKLDNLCEQVNYFKEKPDISYNFEFPGCGCQYCDHHQLELKYNEGNSTSKVAEDDEIIKFTMVNNAEQEERRLSDWSDCAPSVDSTIDVQSWRRSSDPLVEQDICKLQKECEDKDAMIKELSAILNSAESHNSKRISELEDVIRRKNMLITKLRKDLMVLEQKVIHLTRLRRPSSSKSSGSSKKLPAMADNLLYDMDSTTSPSDDSDSSAKKKHRAPVNNMKENQASSIKNGKGHEVPIQNRQNPTLQPVRSNERPVSPLKEKHLNQQVLPVAMLKGSGSDSGNRKSRNGTYTTSMKSRVSRAHKRWV